MKTILTEEQTNNLVGAGVSSEFARARSDYDGVFIDRFSVTDILKIIPKDIKTEDNIYWLAILWTGDTWFVGYRNHNTDEWLYQSSMNFEMIDGLYNTAIWYYGKFLEK